MEQEDILCVSYTSTCDLFMNETVIRSCKRSCLVKVHKALNTFSKIKVSLYVVSIWKQLDGYNR